MDSRELRLKKAITEYLGLLCSSCGASAARLRFYSGEPGSGEPIAEMSGSVPAIPGMELSLREPAPYVEGFGAWRMDGNGYGSEWRLDRRFDGMSVSLDLEMNEVTPSFVPRRLSAAGELLGLLELLIQMVELPASRFETCEGAEAGGIRPFDPSIIGISPSIVSLRSDIRKVAAGEIPVLVCGESGTGKELVARNIHSLGPRAGGPFVAVNCMEMPEGLLQGEMFGSVRGAYTGAVRDREGLIEAASGGTFFLDEIGELPVHLQAALLRVLQEMEVRRLGEGRSRKIDVRFVFATNRDLEEQVRKGRFREDLYFRLNAVRLHIPPLRDRSEDIPVLTARFLGESTVRLYGRSMSITAGALSRLVGYRWPGNVRELRNEIERAVTMNPEAKRMTAAMFEITEGGRGAFPVTDSGFEAGTMPEAVSRLERKMIEKALTGYGGNRTRTAKALGITRQGLLKKLKRMCIDPDLYRDRQVTSAGPPSA
jgi:transcriptional regulator with GAF, ATPase, and Fis domain